MTEKDVKKSGKVLTQSVRCCLQLLKHLDRHMWEHRGADSAMEPLARAQICVDTFDEAEGWLSDFSTTLLSTYDYSRISICRRIVCPIFDMHFSSSCGPVDSVQTFRPHVGNLFVLSVSSSRLVSRVFVLSFCLSSFA